MTSVVLSSATHNWWYDWLNKQKHSRCTCGTHSGVPKIKIVTFEARETSGFNILFHRWSPSLAVVHFTFIVEGEKDGIKAQNCHDCKKIYCGVSFPQPPPSMLKLPFVIMIVRVIESIWTYGIKRLHKLISDCLFFNWLKIHLKNSCSFARISNNADWVCLLLFVVVPKNLLGSNINKDGKRAKMNRC